jgi:hypothetical protein
MTAAKPVIITSVPQKYPFFEASKRLVVIVGQKKAMAIAVKGKQTRRRWSKLREWLEADR